jgi:hypothetical protein
MEPFTTGAYSVGEKFTMTKSAGAEFLGFPELDIFA